MRMIRWRRLRRSLAADPGRWAIDVADTDVTLN
jgi:hypothetical protein